MTVQTIAATLAQDGVSDGAVWAEAGGISVSETLSRVGGFQFNGLPTTSRDRGEFLSLSATAAFNLPSVGAGQVPATVSLYARLQRAPALYSTANLPPALNALTPRGDIILAGEATVTVAGAQTLTFTLKTPALDSARYAGGSLFDFTGFAFHLHARTADGTALVVGETETGVAATLSYTLDTRIFTGIEIEHGRLAESRPDVCPICASESLREEWVWCEWHDRMECPECADPDTDELEDFDDSSEELRGENG